MVQLWRKNNLHEHNTYLLASQQKSDGGQSCPPGADWTREWKKLSVFQKKLSHYYWLAIRCTVSVVTI